MPDKRPLWLRIGNILIDSGDSGRMAVKYINFGLAIELNSDAPAKHGVPRAQLKYMSPELESGEDYSFSADVWSLALVIVQVRDRYANCCECHKFMTASLTDVYRSKRNRRTFCERAQDTQGLLGIIVLLPQARHLRSRRARLHRRW